MRIELPKRTSLAKEKDRVEQAGELNSNEFFNALRRLGRILKKNNPRAQELNAKGQLNYVANEYRIQKGIINRDRVSVRDKVALRRFGRHYDDLSDVAKLAVTSGANLTPIRKKYRSYDDLEQIEKVRFSETDYAYAQNYIDALLDQKEWAAQRDAIIVQIRKLLKTPRAIRYVFDRRDEETQLYYIYAFSKEVVEPFNVRRNNVVKYWLEIVPNELKEAGFDV